MFNVLNNKDYKRKDYYEEVLVLMMERYDVIRIFGKGIGGRVFLVVEKESGKWVYSFIRVFIIVIRVINVLIIYFLIFVWFILL